MRVFAEKSKTAHAANSHVVTAEKVSPPLGRVPEGLPTAGFDFSRIPIQAKLAINTPGDQYEQEADRVAKQVMRVPEPQLQRQCACGGSCPDCKREHTGQEHRGLQLKRVSGDTLGPTEAPPMVHEVLRSPGQPLDAATRAFMEPRFGHDFSRIRVHTDAAAARAAEAIHARAYTVGTRIVFANGLQDRTLLAHELTHVVQQGGRETAIQRSPDPDAGQTSGNLPSGLLLGGSGLDFHRRSPANLLEAALSGSVTIDGFETGQSDVSAVNGETLTTAANTILMFLLKYPASTVRLIGHADAVGREGANQALGQNRADSVQAFLVKAGIPVEAIRTESRGQTDPAVNTRKPEPRNRRVEVRFEPSGRLTKFLPGVSLGIDSQDQAGADGGSQWPGSMADPAGKPFDELWPDATRAPRKPDLVGDLGRAYAVGKPEVPPVTSDVPDPELGGAAGTHVFGRDVLGAVRAGKVLVGKPKKPVTHPTSLASPAEAVIETIEKNALLPATLKDTKVEPDVWVDDAQQFALILYTRMVEAEKNNRSEVSISLPEAYRDVADRAAIKTAIEAITTLVRAVVDDHASKVARVMIYVGQSKEYWGEVDAAVRIDP